MSQTRWTSKAHHFPRTVFNRFFFRKTPKLAIVLGYSGSNFRLQSNKSVTFCFKKSTEHSHPTVWLRKTPSTLGKNPSTSARDHLGLETANPIGIAKAKPNFVEDLWQKYLLIWSLFVSLPTKFAYFLDLSKQQQKTSSHHKGYGWMYHQSGAKTFTPTKSHGTSGEVKRTTSAEVRKNGQGLKGYTLENWFD